MEVPQFGIDLGPIRPECSAVHLSAHTLRGFWMCQPTRFGNRSVCPPWFRALGGWEPWTMRSFAAQGLAFPGVRGF